MRMLSFLHRWTGGLAGLLLAVIGMSGTILLWKDSWVLLDGVNDTAVYDLQGLAQAVRVALETGSGLVTLTFASDEFGLHQAIYADGSGAYIAQNGTVVARWSSLWERPELWLFDLHHYLLLGEAGKTMTGSLGILLLAFSLTGLVLWWRTRKKFRFRLWPSRFTRSAIVRQHRDLGVIAAPLLILSALTGTLMVFPAASAYILSPISRVKPVTPLPADLQSAGQSVDWRRVMTAAATAFNEGAPRRLMMPAKAGAPLTIRYRQDFEWTPNGRSYVWIDPGNAAVVAIEDAAEGDVASFITEKFYPIHAAKVGWLWWRIAMTFAGLSLVLLGILASWSFWTSRIGIRY